MPCVVIIEDQFTSRRILEELVRTLSEDVTVQSFAEPLEALEWVQRHQPDLALVDYKMPRMDGVAFTRQFRLRYKDVPLVIVTGVEDRDVRYQALAAGATDFLTKPIDHQECRARCHNLLELHQQHQVIKGRAAWLEERVAEATKEIRMRERETLLRLAKAGEYRDEETGNHILRMAKYCYLIAKRLGLTEDECLMIEIAAPMHDIGKIGIADRILLKPGKLGAGEREIMKRHAQLGHEILAGSPSHYLRMGAVIALRHHEKFDGSGYPGGLRGEAIPLPARIVAVADVFDALTSERPYKGAWSIPEAIDYIETQKGGHFDPQCVAAFQAELDAIVTIRRTLPDPPRGEER